MALGMNTQSLFIPGFLRERIVDETKELGWTRIEISYYASKIEVEQDLLDIGFAERAA